MKKFFALLVVFALVGISSIALAEVTVGGSVSVRSRNFSDLDFNDANAKTNTTDTVDTQEKVMIDISAKSDKVKGKISLWNDYETWGGLEASQGIASGTTTTITTADPTPGQRYNNNTIGFREAWMSFELPGVPVTVTAGHQLLMVGNGWFFRSMHFGSDAWVVSNTTGNNTVAFVDVKVDEGNTYASDDTDFYVLLDVFKLNENMAIGVNLTNARIGTSDNTLQNLGVTFNGKLGPVALKAQVDQQMGKDKTGTTESKYKGSELVAQGNVALDPVTVNFMVGMGSGSKAGDTDTKEYITVLDIDPHYTFLYEYKVAGPCGIHTGLCNTTVLGAGASFAATKNLTIGADAYFLMATEKVADKVTAGATTDELGTEIDVKINWKLYDNLSWNWNLGYLDPGKGLGKDEATGIQGILAYTF